MTTKEFSTKEFSTKDLLDMGLPDTTPEGGKIISDKIIDKSRWSIHCELIVQFPEQIETDEAWKMYYSYGATECQDESPWEYDDTVVATLVKKREKVVVVWE